MEEQKKKSPSILLVVIITALITCILTSLLFIGGYFVWLNFFKDKSTDTQDTADDNEDTQDENNTEELDDEEEGDADTGTITGTLIFPSEFLPAQKVCAEDINTGDEFCTETEDGDSTYELEVPAGTYYVYAQDLRDVPPYGTNDYRAYYNLFVTCGLSVDCLSHENIEVAVGAGEVVNGIDPNDWYNAE